MKKQDRRQIFYDNKTKLYFTAYIVLTLLFFLFVAGNLFSRILYSFFSPNKISDFIVMNPKLLLTLAVIWTLYGYFIAYTYATSKIKGVIYRMKNIFDRNADKKNHKMTFRKSDPFNDVAKSFNLMIEKIDKIDYIKTQLANLVKQTQGDTKIKIEAIIESI